MLMTCKPSARAEKELRRLLCLEGQEGLTIVEVEFRELPYFMVARSRVKWDAASQGDINVVSLLHVTAEGIVVDPLSQPLPGSDTQAVRHTLIPWQNVISLSITRADSGAKGTHSA